MERLEDAETVYGALMRDGATRILAVDRPSDLLRPRCPEGHRFIAHAGARADGSRVTLGRCHECRTYYRVADTRRAVDPELERLAREEPAIAALFTKPE
jgi:hypothetical protein